MRSSLLSSGNLSFSRSSLRSVVWFNGITHSRRAGTAHLSRLKAKLRCPKATYYISHFFSKTCRACIIILASRKGNIFLWVGENAMHARLCARLCVLRGLMLFFCVSFPLTVLCFLCPATIIIFHRRGSSAALQAGVRKTRTIMRGTQ